MQRQSCPPAFLAEPAKQQLDSKKKKKQHSASCTLHLRAAREAQLPSLAPRSFAAPCQAGRCSIPRGNHRSARELLRIWRASTSGRAPQNQGKRHHLRMPLSWRKLAPNGGSHCHQAHCMFLAMTATTYREANKTSRRYNTYFLFITKSISVNH